MPLSKGIIGKPVRNRCGPAAVIVDKSPVCHFRPRLEGRRGRRRTREPEDLPKRIATSRDKELVANIMEIGFAGSRPLAYS